MQCIIMVKHDFLKKQKKQKTIYGCQKGFQNTTEVELL